MFHMEVIASGRITTYAGRSKYQLVIEQIELGVSAWVDYVGRRPSIARLILREVADASRERGAGVLEQTRRLRELVQREVLDRPDRKETRLAPVDPVHMASAVAGATVFLVAAAVYFLREHLDQLEHWLQRLGPWAPVALLAALPPAVFESIWLLVGGR